MEKKNTKKIAILAVVFLAVIAIIGAIIIATRPQGTDGKKSYTLEVILSDGASKSHQLTTTEEFLGAALREEGLITGSESDYGFFVTGVDGTEADSSNQEWWCLTIDGDISNYGVDEVPVTDGGHYEFTLTVGW